MKNLLFGTLFVLCAILTSCGSTPATTETEKETQDSTTNVETKVSVTTPSVDTAKVHK
jgi:hypothetical protein